MTRDTRLYVKDILDSMEMAERFIKDMTYEAFSRDTKTCYAVTSMTFH